MRNEIADGKSLLQMLFPPITKSFDQKKAVASSHHEWFRDSRVCHPDIFEKYFTFVIPEGELSQAEIDNLLRLTDDVKGFVSAFEALKQRGLFKIAFERLDAYNRKIPLKNMPSLVQALCNMSDAFPERQPTLLGLDVSDYAFRFPDFTSSEEYPEQPVLIFSPTENLRSSAFICGPTSSPLPTEASTLFRLIGVNSCQTPSRHPCLSVSIRGWSPPR